MKGRLGSISGTPSPEPAFGGGWILQGRPARGELVTVLDEFALPAYDIMAVYPQQRHVPAMVRFFIDHLKRLYAVPGYWTSAS